MVIAEIVPAFKGIADKLVKDLETGAGLSERCFPSLRMPSSSGFLASFVAGLFGMFLCPLFGWRRPSGLVPRFSAGPGGVYSNITGGRRGAVVRSFFAHGLLIFRSLPAILFALDGGYGTGLHNLWRHADFSVVGIVLESYHHNV